MRRPARLLTLACVLLGVLLALTSCGGGDDRGAAAPRPSGPPSSAPSEPAPPSPTSSAAGTQVDPCALLDAPDYAALYKKHDLELVSEQINTRGSFMTCATRLQLLAPFWFGFSVDPGAYDQVYAERTPSATYDGPAPEPLTLGDRSFVSVDNVHLVAAAEVGGQTFWVRYAAPNLGFEHIAVGSQDDLVAVLGTLVDHGSGQVSSEPILLPPGCPAPDAAVVTALVGTVEWARGGQNPDGISACGYTGEDGRELHTSYTFLSPRVYDVEAQNSTTLGSVMVDPPPGIIKNWLRGPDGGYDYFALYPDSDPQLELQLSFTGMKGPRAAVTKKFLAWTRAYLAHNEPA
jgi:hypothetical protein